MTAQNQFSAKISAFALAALTSATVLGAVVGGLAATPLGFDRLAWAGVPFAALGWVLLALGQPAKGAAGLAGARRT
jgi:predicted MFS family arabinose efflux permease